MVITRLFSNNEILVRQLLFQLQIIIELDQVITMYDQCIVQPNVYVVIIIVRIIVDDDLVSYSYQEVYNQVAG